MIKAPKNWNEVKAASDRPRLMPGGYVIKIVDVDTFISRAGNECLSLDVDIAEGENKDFYKNDYEAQQNDKKWRGKVISVIPDENASAEDWRAQRFKGLTTAIEHSNEGYTWDWDENKLKGKIVGCLFRSEEFLNNNNEKATSVKPFVLVSADRIREGKYQVPNPKLLKDSDYNSPAKSSLPQGFEAVNDDDIPF